MKRYLLTINFILPVEADDKKTANQKGLDMIASFGGISRPTILSCEEQKIKFNPPLED